MSASSRREATRVYPKSQRVSNESARQSDVGKEILLGNSVNAIRDHPFEISENALAPRSVTSVRGYVPSSRPARSRYSERNGGKVVVHQVSVNPFDEQYKPAFPNQLDDFELENRKIFVPEGSNSNSGQGHVYYSELMAQESAYEEWKLEDRTLFATMPYPPPLNAVYLTRRQLSFSLWSIPSSRFVKSVEDNSYVGGTRVCRQDRVWNKYNHMPRSVIREKVKSGYKDTPIIQAVLAATVIQRWYRRLRRNRYEVDPWEPLREVVMGSRYSEQWIVEGWFSRCKNHMQPSLLALVSDAASSAVPQDNHQLLRNMEFIRGLSVNVEQRDDGCYLFLPRATVDGHDTLCVEWMEALHTHITEVRAAWTGDYHALQSQQSISIRVGGSVSLPLAILATLWEQCAQICPCILSQWLQACKYDQDPTDQKQCWVDSLQQSVRTSHMTETVPMVDNTGAVYYLLRPTSITKIKGASAAMQQGIRPKNEGKGVNKRVSTVMLRETLKQDQQQQQQQQLQSQDIVNHDNNLPITSSKDRLLGYNIDHVAATAIQRMYRQYKVNRFNSDVKAYYARRDSAARSIQRVWRGYADRRVFQYLRDIITSRTLAHPAALLKLVNPSEAHLLDGASGMYARLRLGGACFPPLIYYKVFSARPVTDIGAFAPRNYSGGYSSTSSQKYVRVDNNGWRPIVLPQLQQYMGDGNVPLTYFSKYQPHVQHPDPRMQALAAHITTPNTLRPYHAKKLVRHVDALKQRKNTKLKWLKYLYGIPENPANSGNAEPREDSYGYNILKNTQEAPVFDEHAFWTQIDTAVQHDDMVQWADALDYDTYAATWSVVGTTKPI